MKVTLETVKASGRRESWWKHVTGLAHGVGASAFSGQHLEAGEHDLPYGSVLLHVAPTPQSRRGQVAHVYRLEVAGLVLKASLPWRSAAAVSEAVMGNLLLAPVYEDARPGEEHPLIVHLKKIAPSVHIKVAWESDPAPGGWNPEWGHREDFEPWMVAVSCRTILHGDMLSGTSYIGSIWLRYGEALPVDVLGHLAVKILEANHELLIKAIPKLEPALEQQIRDAGKFLLRWQKEKYEIARAEKSGASS